MEEGTLRKALVKLIVENNLAFTVVESNSFIELITLCNPEAAKLLVGADTVTEDTMKLFLDFKEKLKAYFKEIEASINITLDIWTSPNGKSILGITAHWIDNNWVLRETLIDVVELFQSHTGFNIAAKVFKSFQEYGIDKKVFCITADNASNNKTMAEELNLLMRSFEDEQHLLGMNFK